MREAATEPPGLFDMRLMITSFDMIETGSRLNGVGILDVPVAGQTEETVPPWLLDFLERR